nr:PAS domain-containing protein [uncultured Pedobacter sp.]
MLEHSTSFLVDHLISQSADLICICDEYGKVLKANKTIIDLSEKTLPDIVGQPLESLFSEKNQKLNDLLYSKLLSVNDEEHFINNIIHQDGTLQSVSWQISKFEELRIIRGTLSKSYVNHPELKTDVRLKAIIDNASDCFFILDKDLNVIFQNKAAIKKFAHPQFQTGTNIFFGSFPEETNIKFFGHFKHALINKSHLKFVEFSAILNCWFSIDAIPYGDELNILVCDISDRIVDHKINELELKTFEMNIAKEFPVNDILQFLLKGFQSLYPHLDSSISRIADQKMWPVASTNLPPSYIEAINGETISIETGSCGSAAFLKKSVITFDLATDENWKNFHHLITPFGYKSCWSFPILSNKSFEVMATFALYTKENKTPTENETKSIARLCNIIKIIFEDLKQDDAILMMNNRYKMVTMATNDAIYDWNLITNGVYWSENLYNIFGYTPTEAHQTKNWWINHIHRDDRAQTVKALRDCLRKKESGWIAEYRLKCKNDDFKYVYNRGYIIYDKQNRPISIIGAIQDISGLKEREIKIINQNKRLKEIAQINSHDLRRPVTSILGLISLFDKDNVANDNNKVMIEYLQKATEELDQVIHTIVSKTLEADETIYSKSHKFKISVVPNPAQDPE